MMQGKLNAFVPSNQICQTMTGYEQVCKNIVKHMCLDSLENQIEITF